MNPHTTRIARPYWLTSLALGVLAAPASAQEAFGLWDEPGGMAGTVSFEFYVSTVNGNDMNPGTAAQPFRTTTAALALANLIAPFVQVSVNVAPGVYDDVGPNAETFPLTLPAHGISLETWPQPASLGTPFDRPIFDGAPGVTVIEVNDVGNQDLAPSVVQGLEIQNSGTGIVVDPSLNGAAMAEALLEVELRDNFVHDVMFGIRLNTPAGFVSSYVVEHNEVGDETVIVGRGIEDVTGGASSTLMRSNEVRSFEENITVLGNGETTRPRLFSNLVQIAERNVTLNDCDPFVINNTIAFAINFTTVPQVDGLTWTGNTMVLANNILWNPVAGSLAMAAVDLTTVGAVIAFTNLNEDAAGGLAPGFVGGDFHPGFAGTDLHIGAASAMIGAGTNAIVGAPGAGALFDAFAGVPMRVDVNMDVDLDARVHESVGEGALTVDIGGDEFKTLLAAGAPFPRIDTVDAAGMAPLTQDALGNVTPTPGTNNYAISVFLTGPPNGAFFLLGGFIFNMDLGGAPNGPIYQNALVVAPPVGNALVDLTAGFNVQMATGVFDAAGQATVILPFNNVDPALMEAEIYAQSVVVEPGTNRLSSSNRIKLEFNE